MSEELYNSQGTMRCDQIKTGMWFRNKLGKIFEVGVMDGLTFDGREVNNSRHNKAMIREIDVGGNPITEWTLGCFDHLFTRSHCDFFWPKKEMK